MRVVGAVRRWDFRGDSSGELACDPVSGRFVVARPSDDDVLRAEGCVVTPGLVNAHHHLVQTAFRSLPGTRGVPMREWLRVMGVAYRRAGVDASLAAAAASVGLAEAALRGVTTVADHHLTWLGASVADDVELASAVAAAARSLGVRLVFVRGSAGDDPLRAAESAAAIVEALGRAPCAGVAGASGAGGAGRVGGVAGAAGVGADGFVQVAVGPAGVHSDSKETFALLGEVAARYGLRRRTQANEQVDVAVAAERYGRRPLELLDEWGWLAPDVTLAHLCDVTPSEVRRVAAAGVSVTHAPGCDLPMGWGVAPMAALSDAGAPVGLGTSGGGSNDAGHLLADARLAMQVAPLAGRPVSAREALTWATAGSAGGLGRGPAPGPEAGRALATEAADGPAALGSLEVGAAADFACWDVTGVADAGVADPVGGLLWADPGRRPRHVVVGGRIVVRDYHLVTAGEHDLAAALRRRIDPGSFRRD